MEDAIISSLSTEVMQVNETDCYIEEGCPNGYGARELVRFTTHIKNIGDLDYYIGVLSQGDNNQFEWGDCHGHWHHNGYAKYDLFDMDGNLLPIGFKNGCVMDLSAAEEALPIRLWEHGHLCRLRRHLRFGIELPVDRRDGRGRWYILLVGSCQLRVHS